ncbi:ImmA/IrrE family metallo-endopeptidase [Bradyrhizobium elkanii]|uniref:ImmA/IrrE family metallo-endopeptidase n=1 Tax=Bradyrhizobium elkanii TaxID=29448 RepID=UPI00272C33A0|nr:ImmA/IrrE family metallo-endopeptidase [Bradyrhizobium elkanii]WLA81969.1 ImmA/IrrE family metallo-endopeptidase [Bradyrhizobium elkanii]
MPEASFQPDWFSKPGDTLLTLMEQRELTSETLARKLGCERSVVQGLLSGAVAVDDDLAGELSKHVGGTPSFWRARQAKYLEALSRAARAVPEKNGSEWINLFPHRDIANYGWVDRNAKRDELIRAYLAYFGVSTPEEWRERYERSMRETAFRTSPTFSSKVGAISAWLRRGEIEAAAISCAAWHPERLRNSLQEIRVLTKAKSLAYFLPRVRKFCAEAGVAVVFVRAPSGCRASGATRFISRNKAMVILSFRYLSDDHFWFTFFHELGHLLLHKPSMTFVDGEPGISGELESEANSFAADVLIPPSRRDELMDLPARREQIIRYAYSVGVSAGIVVGQMQHHKVITPKQMNFLKRRFDWQDIQGALN